MVVHKTKFDKSSQALLTLSKNFIAILQQHQMCPFLAEYLALVQHLR